MRNAEMDELPRLDLRRDRGRGHHKQAVAALDLPLLQHFGVFKKHDKKNLVSSRIELQIVRLLKGSVKQKCCLMRSTTRLARNIPASIVAGMAYDDPSLRLIFGLQR